MAHLDVLRAFERAIRLQDFIESLRADAVDGFHGAQDLRARHEHPFGRAFQKLRRELPPDRVEQIVGREHDRLVLHLDRQDVMLENEPARQERQDRAFDLHLVDGDDRHLKIISDRFQEALFIHFAGIEDLTGPGAAVQVRGKFLRFVVRRHAAGEEEID